MINELIEVTVGAHPDKRAVIFAWAVEMFENRVEPHDSLPLLYFQHQEDVTAFLLRWS
jgi:hypothetical protein